MYLDWGDATYTLPDITRSTLQEAFTADNFGADGSGPTGIQPKFYFTGPAADWNDPAGIPNKGSVALPLIKQAGTYS